ncbi:hypothetical protein ACFFJT_20585 [Dyella flava]|uniref:Uncharacterized protein n=1 Tax=Dyella flava TaxID=1920170 RepID=A0ABS2JXP4_9GAMM|nr:hypothetical protein [Dyella flava]MBM7123761.1 hypothetical protein [Dyella flava]
MSILLRAVDTGSLSATGQQLRIPLATSVEGHRSGKRALMLTWHCDVDENGHD